MNETKRLVLFVDDDPLIIRGYQRSVEEYLDEWEPFFCTSGKEALDLLDQQPIDVLITDMRMPVMDGNALLATVIQKYPGVIRLILSGNIEEASAYKAAGLAHQLIAKPCDIRVIREIVEQSCHLRDMLSDKKLVKLVTGIKNLPSMPALYVRLMKEFESEQPTLKQIGNIISQDVAMTAKILQLVNSAFFSLPYNVSNVNQAITILGLNTIQALVLSVGVFTEYQARSSSDFSLETLWQHSITVGNLSRSIAAEAGLNRTAQDEAQLAGILHDVGKLIESEIPGFFQEINKNPNDTYMETEIRILGTSHAEIGAYMLSLWGLPNSVIQAVAYHHSPSRHGSTKFDVVAAVHIANGLYYLAGTDSEMCKQENYLDMEYIQQIQATQMMDGWHSLAKIIMLGEKSD